MFIATGESCSFTTSWLSASAALHTASCLNTFSVSMRVSVSAARCIASVTNRVSSLKSCTAADSLVASRLRMCSGLKDGQMHVAEWKQIVLHLGGFRTLENIERYPFR